MLQQNNTYPGRQGFQTMSDIQLLKWLMFLKLPIAVGLAFLNLAQEVKLQRGIPNNQVFAELQKGKREGIGRDPAISEVFFFFFTPCSYQLYSWKEQKCI